jgi:hypothetical protein
MAVDDPRVGAGCCYACCRRKRCTAALVGGLCVVFVVGGCAGALALSLWGLLALLAPAMVLLAAAVVARFDA